MLKGMDEDTKKMMDKIEETSFFKPSAKEEVKKYVDDGGMERNVMVDGAYRNIDDVDGNKLRKERRISALLDSACNSGNYSWSYPMYNDRERKP